MLPQHPEHRPEDPIFLAVDQQLREGATLRVALELSDPVGALEVGEHEDVEQFEELIRQLHDRPEGQEMADLLIFLEGWEWARQRMIEELSRA